MKKIKNVYSEIYNVNNIYKIYNILRKSTKNKKEVMDFDNHKNLYINDISKELSNRTYKFSKYRLFMVTEPKYRLIMCEKNER